MRHGVASAGMIAIAVSASAAPGGDVRSLSLPAQPLSKSLQAIAERYGIELIFSQSVVGDRLAPPIASRMNAQQALAFVLAGTSLVADWTVDGGYIIAAAPAAVSEQPYATPEILVVGRRTQNTDVRRTENDVRPYQVITRQDVATSHVSTVEELAAQRLPANDPGTTLSQQGAGAQGSTASSINLRGLGADQTLILVDGRRLPMMPGAVVGFNQSDVNALPPESIERVEAITATAGGIYGPGATAGVVNLVLRRDYRGLDLSVTSGVTARGDTPYRRADLRLGLSPDGGATNVMVDVARSDFGGLDVGDRDDRARANARIFDNQPSYFALAGPPSSAALTVVSADGGALSLKPAYGGAQLGAPITFARPADGRSNAELARILTANAGKIDPNPGPDAAGDEQTALSGRRTTSIVASARHSAGPVELFIDYLRLDNDGHARSAYPQNRLSLSADDPNNPFTQVVTVYAPGPSQTISFDFRSRVTRLTGGIIMDLSGGWRAEGDYSSGSGVSRYVSSGQQLTAAGTGSYYAGTIGNPLGDYSTYLDGFSGLIGGYGQTSYQRNRFDNGSIRLAGPILSLPGGDLTVTAQAEQRRERVANGSRYSFSPLVDPAITETLPHYGQITRSLYEELRAPMVDTRSGFRPLRGLELQLAVRRDWVTTDAVQDALAVDGAGTRTVHNAGTVYTVGLKFSPVDGLLVRASASTGQQPLTVSDLSRRKFSGLTLEDPKRPGDIEFYDDISGGAPHPRPGRAQSLSAGIIVQPPTVPNLRLSLDYTHIEKRGEEVISLANNAAYFIANEATYPDRVLRAPLTAEDVARGYSAGVIKHVDESSLQNGRTIIDSVDGLLNYRFQLGQIGRFELHAATAWQPRFRRIVGFGLPSRDYAGASDGAPSFRANGGARLNSGPVTLSADAQLTGEYRITSALEFLRDLSEEFDIVQQGGVTIPAQASFDVAAEYRVSIAGGGLSGRPRTFDIRFGVQNVLDIRPATVVNAIGGYNNYLDPRRRRFDLTMAVGL
jgi:iron complex outermembrane receptor protein